MMEISGYGISTANVGSFVVYSVESMDVSCIFAAQLRTGNGCLSAPRVQIHETKRSLVTPVLT